MDRIDDLAAYVAIVERGGQSAAARALQRSLQSINRSLATLERGVGVTLIQRTTRHSMPTEAGLAYYTRIKAALDEIAHARAEAAGHMRAFAGMLRIAAPAAFSRAFVVPALTELLERFPTLAVELRASDRPADLLGERFDVAVRVRRLRDSSLRARRLGDLRVGVYGARNYPERHGRPAHPRELVHHACVLRTQDGNNEPWPFRIESRLHDVAVQGRFASDDSATVQAAVIGGVGLALGPLWQVHEALERGDLEVVLQPFEVERLPVHAVLPPARTQPAKVRAFVDLAVGAGGGVAALAGCSRNQLQEALPSPIHWATLR